MSNADENMVDSCDLDGIELVALAAANQASDLLKSGFYSNLDVSVKTHMHDLVTQFDVKAEETIISVIRKAYPDHAIIAEESGTSNDPCNKITWIIDPLDGTWNFAKQIPSFAVSIAVAHKGVVYIGVCLDPISGELFIGRKGKGATMNGKKISVSKTTSLKECGISLGAHVGLSEIHKIALIRRTGSSVLDLCYVAKGALDSFIENKLNVWDFAAAKLIVEEAGGLVTDFSGNPLTLDHSQPSEVLATNNAMHKEITEWISTERK